MENNKKQLQDAQQLLDSLKNYVKQEKQALLELGYSNDGYLDTDLLKGLYLKRIQKRRKNQFSEEDYYSYVYVSNVDGVEIEKYGFLYAIKTYCVIPTNIYGIKNMSEYELCTKEEFETEFDKAISQFKTLSNI